MEETEDLAPGGDLSAKIARLVEERGWNQEEFARISDLNRHTVRQILLPGRHRQLRNSSIRKIADALNLTVNELRNEPLDRLLPRMNQAHPANTTGWRRLYEQARQPELVAWLERNPDRASQLSADEIDELLALQGPEGPLAAFGVESFVERLERRRRLLQRVAVIAGTEYLDLLEQMVGLLYDKVQPSAR
jgi:transcriptional regulator with XRE-family HTH domain